MSRGRILLLYYTDMTSIQKSIIAVGAIIIVISLGFFVYLERAHAPEKSLEAFDTTSQKNLRSLLGSGESQKCSFTQKSGIEDMKGTVYIAGGRMRGDFSSHMGSTEVVGTHMITDGHEHRIWTDKDLFGVVIKAESMPQPGNALEPKSQASPLNLDAAANLSCEKWQTNETVFQPPTNIVFHSMIQPSMGNTGTTSGMMGTTTMMSTTTTGKPEVSMGKPPRGAELKLLQSQTCEKILTEDSKTQCKAAFKCG